MKKFRRYLLLSQINLFGWLLLSSIIVSSVVFNNGGVSNYGNHYSTAPLYAFASLILGGAISILIGHYAINNSIVHPVRVMLIATALVYVAIFGAIRYRRSADIS